MTPLSEASLAFLLQESKDPSARWRSAPFWALNGKLEPEELKRQIRGFQTLGLGGFYLHARTGLETPYLSEEWFKCINAAVEEARRLGMEAWLYDEDRFPSGFGGGLITSDPAYRAKGITYKALTAQAFSQEGLPETALALFAARITGNTARNCRRLDLNSPPVTGQDESLLLFYTDTIACSSWYNNYTYLDTLSVEAVEKFISLTHEAYARHCPAEFGKTIPGIFTDEPRYGFLIDQPQWDVEKRKFLPWTPGFLEAFQETYHYDLLDRLPEYFFEVEGADSVMPRVNYTALLLKFFKRAFWEPIHRWCREHDLALTGHPVAEDSLSLQTGGIGSAMQLYEYMERPGIDLLTEHNRAYLAAKQVSSAARQFGRERRLVETYGCTGWDFSLAGMKALGDWLYALGINYRCEHLAFYTVEGEAKRDYPCPVALQSNAPESYRELNDYFARLSVWLSAGEEERSILLIHPVESAWSLFHQGWKQEEKTLEFDRAFTGLCHTLLAHQLDFDLGDEELLSRIGEIREKTLYAGKAAYRLVIVPSLITLRRSTYELLKAFQAAGGTVISLGEVPRYLDAVRQEFAWPFKEMPDEQELVLTAQPFGAVRISGADGGVCPALLHQIRRGNGWDCLFICNTGEAVNNGNYGAGCGSDKAVCDREEEYPDVTVFWQSACGKELMELDPMTGALHRVNARRSGENWIIRSSFGRLASRLFIAVTQETSETFPEALSPFVRGETCLQKIAPVRWQAELSELNVAVLDHFSTAPEEEPRYVLELDDSLRRSLGVEVRNFMMPQPWCRQPDKVPGGEVTCFALFTCDHLPEGDVFLTAEHPELYRFFLNGQPLEGKDCGFWHAPAWRKLRFSSALLKKGKNILSFRTRICNGHPGLESLFLLGDFGVRCEGTSFAHLPPARELTLGDWTEQGLPFYPGKVTYKTQVVWAGGRKGRIRLPGYGGTPAVCSVNGQKAGTLLFSPDQTPLFDLPGTFDLQLTLTGSMRNACGPFFLEEERPLFFGPESYKRKEISFRRLGACGLFEAPEIC